MHKKKHKHKSQASSTGLYICNSNLEALILIYVYHKLCVKWDKTLLRFFKI